MSHQPAQCCFDSETNALGLCCLIFSLMNVCTVSFHSCVVEFDVRCTAFESISPALQTALRTEISDQTQTVP